MRRIETSLGQPSQRWAVTSWGVLLAIYDGRFDEASAGVEAAFAIGAHSLPWNATAMHRLQTFTLLDIQDRLEGFRDSARQSAAEYPDYPIFAAVLVYVAARLGDHEDARAAMSRLAPAGFDRVGHDEMRLGAMTLLGWAAAELGAEDAAAAIYDELLPHAGLVAVAPPELCPDAVGRSLGRLAARLGRWDDAERHYSDALELNVRIGARPWVALTALEHAEMLVARGRAPDRARVVQLAGRAAADYRKLGIASRAAEAEALVAGADRGASSAVP